MNSRKKISTIGPYAILAAPLALAILAWNMGGGAIPDAAELLAAPLSIVDEGGVMSVTSEPYWDHTQFKIAPQGDYTKCANGALVVPLNLVATLGALDEIDIKAVWAHQNGQWWKGTVDEVQTKDGNGHKSLVAYGCASSLFKPFALTDIVVKLSKKGRISYLRATSKKLHDVPSVEHTAN